MWFTDTHSPTCTLANDGVLNFMDDIAPMPDPECPRCAARLATGHWPVDPMDTLEETHGKV